MEVLTRTYINGGCMAPTHTHTHTHTHNPSPAPFPQSVAVEITLKTLHACCPPQVISEGAFFPNDPLITRRGVTCLWTSSLPAHPPLPLSLVVFPLVLWWRNLVSDFRVICTHHLSAMSPNIYQHLIVQQRYYKKIYLLSAKISFQK